MTIARVKHSMNLKTYTEFHRETQRYTEVFHVNSSIVYRL
jgi:hypothetical protein